MLKVSHFVWGARYFKLGSYIQMNILSCVGCTYLKNDYKYMFYQLSTLLYI